MKIGIVCPNSIARGGGVQSYVFAIQAVLKKRGHEAVIITLRPKEYRDKEKRGVIFLGAGTDFRSPMQTTTQISASIDTSEIDEMLERENFDVLHFHEPWIPVLSRQILSRSNVANVGTFHAKLPDTLMSKTISRVVTPYTKPLLKYLDVLTAVSPAASEYVSSLTDEPIVIVPDGIDLKHFHAPRGVAKTASNQTKTLLYVNRLEKRKGLKYLLRAYKIVSYDRDDISLVIVGDGPDRSKLEQYARELELPRVKFLGYISEARKAKLFRSSDLFVTPALHGESFGIVLLEAMASGLPIVAGDNDGYSYVMQGLGALSLVNVRDSIEFARRIELMLGEPTIRSLWRKWALEYVKQFDYERVVDRYLEVYEQAILAKALPKKRKRAARAARR